MPECTNSVLKAKLTLPPQALPSAGFKGFISASTIQSTPGDLSCSFYGTGMSMSTNSYFIAYTLYCCLIKKTINN